MAVDALLVDELLRRDIAGSEQHRRRETLGEQRPGGQPGLVPGQTCQWVIQLFVVTCLPAELLLAQDLWGALALDIR